VNGPAALAALLARAFDADPMLRWVLPDAGRRVRVLRSLFAANLRHAARYGRIDPAGGDAGAALWLGSASTMTAWRSLLSRHVFLPLQMALPEWRRLHRLHAYAAMQHRRVASGPHWYLQCVGIDPPLQRRGAGTALIRIGLERADRSRLPCYLETAREETLPFYERLGFRLAIPGRLPPDGPPLWSMLRPARK
jgi:ribosomal protein S18 acetylase RimI-like enzyme